MVSVISFCQPLKLAPHPLQTTIPGSSHAMSSKKSSAAQKRKHDEEEDKKKKKAEQQSSEEEEEDEKKEEEEEEKEEKPKVKPDPDAPKEETKDVKPKISRAPSKKKVPQQPPGSRLVTMDNSSGRSGLCRVLVRNVHKEGDEKMEDITEEWLDGSPSFQALNDKGARGCPVTVNPDALVMLDAAAIAFVDKLLLNATFFHFEVDKLGLATNSANGEIVHPKQQAAKGKAVSQKGKFVIKPYSVSTAVQMDESLRELLGDVKMPDDTRAPLVFDVNEAMLEPNSKKAKKGEKVPASEAAAQALTKILKDYDIHV